MLRARQPLSYTLSSQRVSREGAVSSLIDTQPRIAQNAKNDVYNGEFAWPTVIIGAVSTLSYFAVPFAVHAGIISFPVALALMSLLVYLAYTPMHESVHRAVSGSHHEFMPINEWIGRLTALVLAVPMIAHRHEHLAHHRYANDPERDPDFAWASFSRAPVRATITSLLSSYRFFLSPRHGKRSAADTRIFWSELLAILGVRLAIISLTDPTTTLVLFIVSGLTGIFILGFLFSFMVHRPFTNIGRHLDTGTLIAPRPLNGLVTWLWMFQNYHSVHHLYPRVPFYRYRRVFEAQGDEMMAAGSPVYRITLKGLQKIERLHG